MKMSEALLQIKALSTPLRNLPWDPQEPLTQLQMAALLDEISVIATNALNDRKTEHVPIL